MKLRRNLLQLDFDEKIIFFLHRHPFVFFKRSLFYLALAAGPFLVYFVLKIYFPWVLEHKILYPLLVLLASIWLIFVWISLFQSWLEYYFCIWVATNKQIIDIKQAGLFNRTIAKQPLSRIQDVSAESRGFFATIFRYGNVYIQSAGAKERFVFKEIKNPYSIARQVNKLARESLEKSV